ncbi:helicase, partial [Pseudomonas aeruginosa]
FVHGLQDPASIDKECDAVINQVREKVAASRTDTELLTDNHPLEAVETQKWRDHPAQYWLERAVTTGLPTRGGAAEQSDHAWRLQWADGSESFPVCFDARTAEQNPEMEWITLEDPRARALISDLPRCVADQPLPVVQVTGLPQNVQGIWSLWSVSLAAANSSANFTRRRFLPVFVTDDGRSFVPTAKRIWDLLLTEDVCLAADPDRENAAALFEQSLTAAKGQGERLFSELLEEHRAWLAEERERARYAFESRFQAIGRIGLPAVREHRRKRLEAEHQARMANLAEAEACTPELNAVLILRIGPAGGTSP